MERPARTEGDLPVRTWWIAALVGLALVLRGIGLGGGLWVDEIYSLLNSFRPPLGHIVTVFPRDNQHPLYSVLAHVSLSAFGESAWSIRLPAVLFGAATVPFLYLLGRMVVSRREAWFATLLLTVSYHHVWFSQNARGYSALAFFAVVSTWLLLRAADSGRRDLWTWYAVAAALGAYTHLTMVFLVVAHFVACVLSLWPRLRLRDQPLDWRPALLGFVLAGGFTLLLYAPILTQVQDYFVNRPSQLKGVSTPSWAILEGFRVLMLGLGAGVGTLAAIIVLTAMLLFGIGLWQLWRERPFALLLFLLPGVVTIAGALVARGTMYPRFFFSLIGFGILIGVRGLVTAAHWLAWRFRPVQGEPLGHRLALAATTALVLLSLVSLRFNYAHPKQDFAGARNYVERERGAGEAIVTAGVTSLPYRDYFHLPWESVDTPEALARVRAEYPRTWLVYTFPRYLERSAPEVMQTIQRDCPTDRVFPGTVGGGDIIVCAMPPRAALTALGQVR